MLARYLRRLGLRPKGMDFEGTIAGPDAFAQSHATLSTSPDSSFVRNVIVCRRDATGADRMVNLSVRRHGDRATDRWHQSRT